MKREDLPYPARNEDGAIERLRARADACETWHITVRRDDLRMLLAVLDSSAPILAALDEWYARHLAWYEATDPHSVTPTRFDSAHYEMAAAWQRVVRALESAKQGEKQ